MDMLETALDTGHDKDDADAEEQLQLAATADVCGRTLIKECLADEVEDACSSITDSEKINIDSSCSLGGGGETADEQAAAIASVTGSGTLTIDPTLQYQLRADSGTSGQVTYRVVQVSNEGEATAQVVAGNFPGNQVAVIQSPFSNGGSPTSDQQGETRFAYFPAATADGAVVTTQTETIAAANGGPFYVMMSPQDVLQNTQRTIAPRTSFSPKLEGRSTRDDRRRATHNEVERRRRDKINNWIVQLSKLVPDCAQEQVKQTQASKGGILAKACEYIQELRTNNLRLSETIKDNERVVVDTELLRSQVEELKKQNDMLRAILLQKGLAIPPELMSDIV